MFRWWTWFGGRSRAAAPYGLNIFLDAAREPIVLIAESEPVFVTATLREVGWLIADVVGLFLPADTEPLFLIAKVP